jgi:hypothetical protein
MYFMTASATTTDAERAPNPRFPQRHTPSAPKAKKQTAEEKDLERRQREEEEEEEEESRRGFAAKRTLRW